MDFDLYYLHGFNSGLKPDSEKIRKLKTLGQVTMLEYDSFDTRENILAQLEEDTRAHLDPVFVGTSLGAYYAYELAHKLCAASILINPAINPGEHLREGIGNTFENYVTGERRTLTGKSVNSYIGKEMKRLFNGTSFKPLLLLDEGDEIFDSKETMEVFADSSSDTHLFKGGSHRFEHLEEALPVISAYAHVCGYVTDLNC